MKILITGASGFCGRHLLPLLKDSGHEIHNVVRTSRSQKNEYVWNFSDPLPQVLPKCDVVIHLAAHVDFGTDFNPETHIINSGATTKLTAYAKKHNAYFIFTSMAGVHGSSEYINQESPIYLINNYTVSKYIAELAVQSHLENYSILRISGIYGLEGPLHLGLNGAIRNAFYKEETPILYGPGSMKRNYIYVADVAKWVHFLLETFKKKGSAQQDILYLAGPETFSIREYLEAVSTHLLNNKNIDVRDGKDSTDFVVHPNPSPVPLTPFYKYLERLALKKVKIA